MKHKNKKKHLYFRTLGNVLIIGGIFILLKTFFFPVKEELAYLYKNMTGAEYEVEAPRPTGQLQSLIKKGKKQIIVPADTQFSIVIPKMQANSRVIANVDPSNESIYLDALNKGVAHAAGTAYPGERGHIFLFAHSTDYFWNIQSYNAIFYLLYKLEKGDEINVFYKGQRYVYEMDSSKIVDPSEVDYLTRKTSDESLTLQTCWPPGTTLKRLLVFAKPVVK